MQEICSNNFYYIKQHEHDTTFIPDNTKSGSGRTKNSRCYEQDVKLARTRKNKRAKLSRRKNR